MRRVVAVVCAVTLFAASGCGGGNAGDAPGTEIRVPPELERRAVDRGAYAEPLGASVLLEPAREDETYLRTFVTTFTSMTPENALKWERVHPERGEWRFARADELVELGRRTGKRVRGHTLVWDQQLPAWVEEGDWSRDELAAVLREHVTTLVRRYRGRIAEWDVVNEPFDEDGAWTQSVWYRVLGEDYVAMAFRAARAADPDARLFLNEVGAERPSPRARSLRRLAADLVDAGVPIDGVGFQNHTTVGNYPTRAELLRTFRSYERLGLDTAITEMDVVIPPGAAPRDALDEQAQAYEAAARACVEADSCTGITVWGVGDEHSWKGAETRALLFGADWAPKPALEAVLGVLER